MNDKIYQLVLEKLSGAVDCPAKNDIAEELTADLTDKYNDLIAQGKTEEQALNELRDGMGDMAEVVTFINEGNRQQQKQQKQQSGGSGTEQAFSDLEDSLRRLAQELTTNLKPGLREVADDLKSAAIHARDAAKEASGPLGEMGRQVSREVSSGLRSAARSINITYSRGDNRYDYELEDAGVNAIDVRTAAGGDVVFGVSENDKIYVVEHASSELPEDKRASIEIVDGTLRIAQGQRSSSGFVFFGYGALHSDFEIYLPRRAYDSVTVVTADGDVDLDEDRDIREISVKTTSGDIELPRLRCAGVRITTVSGDVSLDGGLGEVDVQSVSGDIGLGGSLSSVSLHTTSGDASLRLTAVPERLDAESVSGDVTIYLPDNDGFVLRYKRVSGDLRSDFALTTSFGSKSGYATYKDNSAREYSMSTVSGDLKLMKR